MEKKTGKSENKKILEEVLTLLGTTMPFQMEKQDRKILDKAYAAVKKLYNQIP